MLEVRFSTLENQIRNFYNLFLKKECEDRSRSVVDSSNLETDQFEPNGLSFASNLSLTEKILLGVFQWYMPKELGVLTNLWLEEHWGGEFKEIKAVLLNSKDTALGYLLVSDRWSTRDFYGNILKENNVKRILLSMKVRRRNKSRPKRKVWRRGYNDKGSTRLPHDSVRFDYRKLKSVIQTIEEQELLDSKIESLFFIIGQRIEKDEILDYYDSIEF